MTMNSEEEILKSSTKYITNEILIQMMGAANFQCFSYRMTWSHLNNH
jgi:hypothetical protein